MLEALEHFHFLRPEWLALAPVIAVLEWLFRPTKANDDPFKGIIEPTLLSHLRLQQYRRRRFNPASAMTALFALIIVVLAGPSWRQQPSPLAEDAAPLVLVLDVSESMAQTDVAPSRLERARQKLSDLLAAAPDKRVAIVVYAGSAHTVLPLTADHDIARNYLFALNTDIAPRPGKFPEYALSAIDKALVNTAYSASVVWVTDGLGSDSPGLIGSWCRRSPHQSLFFGIGSVEDGSTPLARTRLEDIAHSCGGDYVEVTIDDRDVRSILTKLSNSYRIIDDEALPWLDGGYPLVFPAMLLSLLWFRKGWTRVWSWWLLLPLLTLPADSGWAQAARDRAITQSPIIEQEEPSWLEKATDVFALLWLSPDQYGRLLLELEQPAHAARVFEHPLWQATAHYYAGDFQQAATLFTRQDSDAALFNEANAHAHRRDYIRALARYQTLLKRNPHFPGARENRDWVQGIVDEINRLSESQPDEAGVGSEDINPEEDPQIGDGADVKLAEMEQRQQYSADELLASPETAAMWLRNVQQDPSDFLSTKFSIQLQERGVSEP